LQPISSPIVEDIDVIEAFVNGGSRNAFGPLIHVERDVLLLSAVSPAGCSAARSNLSGSRSCLPRPCPCVLPPLAR
ncbi:MAG: hypothetical protein M3256_05750, partial [Actinomycetota bacterium]|nr:hypothetical protein [Actinomycetota bacterium]